MQEILERIPVAHPEAEPKQDLSRFGSLAERVHTIGSPRVFPDTSPDIAETEILDVSDEVQQAVRDSLRFEKFASTQELCNTGTTTCVGYSVVGSEALEQCEVDHYVGFVNGHSTIFLKIPGSKGTKLYMRDMLTPGFNQDVSRSLTLYSESDSIEVDGKSSERHFALMNSSRLVLPEDDDFINATNKFPWLSVKKCHSYHDVEENSQLFVTLMEPDMGRKVMLGYGDFKSAFRDGDYISAAEAVISISGAFPEVDARSEITKNIRSVVTSLAKEGDYELAQKVIEAFFSSYVGNDTRISETQGDCYREIAKRSKETVFAELARISYQESKSAKRRAMQGRLTAKMALARQLQAEAS